MADVEREPGAGVPSDSDQPVPEQTEPEAGRNDAERASEEFGSDDILDEMNKLAAELDSEAPASDDFAEPTAADQPADVPAEDDLAAETVSEPAEEVPSVTDQPEADQPEPESVAVEAEPVSEEAGSDDILDEISKLAAELDSEVPASDDFAEPTAADQPADVPAEDDLAAETVPEPAEEVPSVTDQPEADQPEPESVAVEAEPVSEEAGSDDILDEIGKLAAELDSEAPASDDFAEPTAADQPADVPAEDDLAAETVPEPAEEVPSVTDQPEADQPEPESVAVEAEPVSEEAGSDDILDEIGKLAAELDSEIPAGADIAEPADQPSDETLSATEESPADVDVQMEDPLYAAMAQSVSAAPAEADGESAMPESADAAAVELEDEPSVEAEPDIEPESTEESGVEVEPETGAVGVEEETVQAEAGQEIETDSSDEMFAESQAETEAEEVGAEGEVVEAEAGQEIETDSFDEMSADSQAETEAEEVGAEGAAVQAEAGQEVPDVSVEDTEVEAEGEPETAVVQVVDSLPPTESEQEAEEGPDRASDEAAAEISPEKEPVGRRIRAALMTPRALTSLAAGITVALVSFAILSLHVVQPPESLVTQLSESEMPAETLVRAESMAADGVINQAVALLDRVTDRGEPIAERADMLYLAAELADRLAGPEPDGATRERLRSRYEDALTENAGHRKTPAAMHRLGIIYMKQSNFGAARERFQDIIETFPDYADLDGVQISIAESHFLEGTYRVAERQLLRIIPSGMLAKNRVRAEVLLGRVLEAGGKTDSAAKVYARLAEQHPGTEAAAASSERLAGIAVERGDHGAAVQLLEQLIGDTVDVASNDRLVLELAKAYYVQKDYRRAERRCRDLMDLFPDSSYTADAVALLSHTLAACDRLAEAEQIALEGTIRFPESAVIVEVLADLCFDKLDFENAREYYAKAAKLDPGRLSAQFRVGESAMKLAEYSAAVNAFSAVAGTEPIRGRIQYQAHLQLADAYVAAGSADLAIESLLSYLTDFATQDKRRPILIRLAQVYSGLGLNANAASIYEQIAGSSTTDEILIEAAAAYSSAGEWDRARLLLLRANIDNMSSATAYRAMLLKGDLLRRIGDLRGSIAQLADAHSQHPDVRTLAGMSALLDGYLADDKMASARTIVKDIREAAVRSGSAATFAAGPYLRWGDYLYDQGDYGGAADVYNEITVETDAGSEAREWAQYQYANSLFNLERFSEAERLFTEFIVQYSKSPWVKAAQTRVNYVAAERRFRGLG